MACSATCKQYLKELPKVEQHMHIEGSLEPGLLFRLAKANSIELDKSMFTSIEALEERYRNFTSLDDFLAYYNAAMAALIKEQDFEELAMEYMTKAHNDGVLHAEVFFDPQAHTERGIDLKVVVKGLTAGLEKGEQKYGMSTKLIMCFVKHLPVDNSLRAVESIIPFVKSGHVSGLGMDSTEKGNPPEKFKPVYEKARELGIENLTGHVGEEGTADNVRMFVEGYGMGINRVDHGIVSANDPSLLDLLAQRKTLVTVCPLSNVRLRCVKEVKEVPLPKFIEKGVRFSINSDDPAYFGGYILDNYVAVQEAFGFTKEIWTSIVRNSIEGSWCDEQRKSQLSEALERHTAAWADKSIA